MLHLGICDDEKEHRRQVYEMFSRALFSYDEIEIDFVYFKMAEEVIEAIEQNEFFVDLLLLDIHMPGKDGLRLAVYILSRQIDVDIIFITVSPDHVFDGYTYQAFTYLLKPLDYGRIREEVKRYVELKNQNTDCLHIKINGREEKVILNEVFYISAGGRKVYFHTRDEEMSAYAKMDEMEATLEEFGFFRCHQSYLVNEKFVEAHSRVTLTVAGTDVPISRKYVESVRNRMDAALQGEARKGG